MMPVACGTERTPPSNASGSTLRALNPQGNLAIAPTRKAIWSSMYRSWS